MYALTLRRHAYISGKTPDCVTTIMCMSCWWLFYLHVIELLLMQCCIYFDKFNCWISQNIIPVQLEGKLAWTFVSTKCEIKIDSVNPTTIDSFVPFIPQHSLPHHEYFTLSANAAYIFAKFNCWVSYTIIPVQHKDDSHILLISC